MKLVAISKVVTLLFISFSGVSLHAMEKEEKPLDNERTPAFFEELYIGANNMEKYIETISDTFGKDLEKFFTNFASAPEKERINMLEKLTSATTKFTNPEQKAALAYCVETLICCRCIYAKEEEKTNNLKAFMFLFSDTKFLEAVSIQTVIKAALSALNPIAPLLLLSREPVRNYLLKNAGPELKLLCAAYKNDIESFKKYLAEIKWKEHDKHDKAWLNGSIIAFLVYTNTKKCLEVFLDAGHTTLCDSKMYHLILNMIQKEGLGIFMLFSQYDISYVTYPKIYISKNSFYQEK